MKELTPNEFWNGIKIEDYKVNIVMNKSCLAMEHINSKITTFDDFKYKELEEKLNNFFGKYDKILLNIPFGDLKRRFKTLTEKLGYKIERTTSLEEVTANYERIYVVITK